MNSICYREGATPTEPDPDSPIGLLGRALEGLDRCLLGGDERASEADAEASGRVAWVRP